MARIQIAVGDWTEVIASEATAMLLSFEGGEVRYITGGDGTEDYKEGHLVKRGSSYQVVIPAGITVHAQADYEAVTAVATPFGV
jgi:hypothetical protein